MEKNNQELAMKVLTMLEEQKKYFEYRRKGLPEASSQLDKCKRLERETKQMAEEIIKGKQEKLF